MVRQIFKIIATSEFLTALRFRPGLCPRPRRGSLQCSPGHLSGL